MTSCIACERCARDCPVGCIYIGKERVAGRKGFQVTSFTVDYGKCMLCAICTENCPVDCIFLGSSYDLSCYSREGSLVDFSRLPLEAAWGRATLNPAVVANSKIIARPVHGGPRRTIKPWMRSPSRRVDLDALQKPRHCLQYFSLVSPFLLRQA